MPRKNWKFTAFADGQSVESWWDRFSRNWITQHKDAAGNQIGEAAYAGHQENAKFNHRFLVSQARKTSVEA